MVSSQLHYTKRNRFMPFLLAEILNFQGSTHLIGVGSFSKIISSAQYRKLRRKCGNENVVHWIDNNAKGRSVSMQSGT